MALKIDDVQDLADVRYLGYTLVEDGSTGVFTIWFVQRGTSERRIIADVDGRVVSVGKINQHYKRSRLYPHGK